MGLLGNILKKVGVYKQNPELRTVASEIDKLERLHQQNKKSMLKKDPNAVTADFFSKRLKEAEDVHAEIVFIRQVRTEFKAQRKSATDRLAVAEKELNQANVEIDAAQEFFLSLGFYEKNLDEKESVCDSFERKIDDLLKSREEKYKEINQLISAGKKHSDNYKNLMTQVDGINAELKENRKDLEKATENQKFYSTTVQEYHEEEEITLDKLEKNQKKKIDLEKEINDLKDKIARMTIYIEGTYTYTKRLYMMESEQTPTGE